MENDELTQYLNALQREECYRVNETLKESPFETTQLVTYIGANGAEGGPYIRKFISRESGMGCAYERIYEAQQAGKRFRHIPRVLECYAHNDQLAVVMEYVHGETLQDYVYRNDPSFELARQVFPQLCDAVTELHEDFSPAIIHRDLKPSNIILSEGNLTIIDFGISREYKADATADTTHLGTRAFAPPEQFGYGQTSVRSDVYALGLILYFCLTEKIPDSAVLSSHFEGEVIPDPLRAVIVHATRFDPEQRYASVRQLKEAFILACQGRWTSQPEPMASGAAGAPTSTPTWQTSQPTVVAPTMQTAPTPVTNWHTMPTSTPSVPATPAPEPQYHLITMRNIALWLILGVLLWMSISLAINPGESTSKYPAWVNLIGYLVVVPLASIGGVWLFMDKRGFVQRFPRLGRFTLAHWVFMYIVLLVVLFLICGAMGMAIGA